MEGRVALHVGHGALLVLGDLLELLLELALRGGLAVEVTLHAGERVLQLDARLLGGEVLRASALDVLAHGVDQLGLEGVVGAEGADLALEVRDLDADALEVTLLVGAHLGFLVALHGGSAQLRLHGRHLRRERGNAGVVRVVGHAHLGFLGLEGGSGVFGLLLEDELVRRGHGRKRRDRASEEGDEDDEDLGQDVHGRCLR